MSVFSRTGFSAKSYAAFRPTYPQTLYTKILSLAQTPKDGTLLDLGCGHGIAASSLSPHFSRTFALDPSEGMISQAKIQHSYDDKKISFRTGPAEDLSFLPSSSVDLVVSAQAAHWFDYSRLWPELARIVRSEGMLAFWGYKDNVILGFPQVNAILDRFIYGEGEVVPGVEGLGRYWEQPGREILRGLYRSIQPPGEDWSNVQRFEHEAGVEGESGWTLRKKMTLGAIESYHRTYSSYNAWKDANAATNGKEKRRDVYDVMWETIIDAVEPWKQQRDTWRDIEVETDWGTCLLMARRK